MCYCPSMSKQLKFDQVAQATLSLMHLHGSSGVSHSRVARLAKVSRPWLYKYIGKKPKDLIEFASDHFGKQLVELGATPAPIETKDQLSQHAVAVTWSLMDSFNDHPEILSIYFRYAGQKNPVGEKIKDLEALQFQTLSTGIAKHFSIPKSEAVLVAELMMAVRMGLCFRFTQMGLGKRHSQKEIQKALRRLFQHTVTALKAGEEK